MHDRLEAKRDKDYTVSGYRQYKWGMVCTGGVSMYFHPDIQGSYRLPLKMQGERKVASGRDTSKRTESRVDSEDIGQPVLINIRSSIGG